MNNKVEIQIEDLEFSDGKIGFIVNSFSSTYGNGSPCYNDKEIKEAVKYAKKTILEAGDKPIVVDKRKVKTSIEYKLLTDFVRC
jgi:hypothetical protein